MTITHFITDNDGVNIDSEQLAMRIMDDEGVKFVQKYGSVTPPKDFIYRTYPGTSTDKIVLALMTKDYNLPVAQIAADYGMPKGSTADDVATHVADLITIETIRRFKTELKSIPGTTEAWTELQKMLGADNIALATTSRADRMDVSLNYAVDPVTGAGARLRDFFPVGELCRSGYGHSNKYDEAFGALAHKGYKPENTVILEDSESGVSKARAGRPDVKIIGTVASVFYEDKAAQVTALLKKGADVVISDMADLPNAVRWLNTGLELTQRPAFKAGVYAGCVRPGCAPANAPAPNVT